MRGIQGEPSSLKGIPIKVYIEISTKISTTWILMARGAIIKGRQSRQGLLDFHATRTTRYNFMRIHRQTHLMCERTLNNFHECVNLFVSGHSTWRLATKVPNILCVSYCFVCHCNYLVFMLLHSFCEFCVMNVQLDIHVYIYVFNCWVWQKVLCTNKVKIKGNSVLFHCQYFLNKI